MNTRDVLQIGRFDELENRYRAIDAADQVPIARLGLYATASMQHLSEHEQAFRRLKNDGFLCAEIHARDREWYDRAAARIVATLDEAVENRTIRAVDTRQVGAMFLDTILGLMSRRTTAVAAPSIIENDVRVLMDLYLFGLAPQH